MLAILIFAMMGTVVDLVLYVHYQDSWQWIPFALLGVAAASLAGLVAFPRGATVRAFRVAMVLLIAGGVAGIVFHVQASAEFHGELDWQAERWHSIMVVLHSKVPPTLAPGGLMQMGLLGLAATYRHPVFSKRIEQGDKS